MHIAVFTDYYLPTLGGVQTSIKAQKDTLEKAGHKVTIFCPLHQTSTDPSIVRLPTSTRFKPDNYPFAWSPDAVIDASISHIRELGDVDIIHIHSEMAAAIGGIHAGQSLRIPIVQTMHGRVDVYTKNVLPLPSVSTFILASLHRRSIPLADIPLTPAHYTRTRLARRMWRLLVNQANQAQHVIVPSHHFARKLHDQGVIKPLTVLSNGLEPAVLDQLPPCAPRTRSAGEPLRVMWCARVSQEKRPLAFLEAIRQLPPTVIADMYGTGPALSSVRRFIRRHGLEQRVHLHGSVPQNAVLEAMRNHHVFVSTSFDFDNQPMVFLEAIAAGTPILYCDPDLSETVPDGGGILTTSPDAQDVAATLRNILNHPDCISEMSEHMIAARGTTMQHQYTDQLLTVYSEAIKALRN